MFLIQSDHRTRHTLPYLQDSKNKPLHGWSAIRNASKESTIHFLPWHVLPPRRTPRSLRRRVRLRRVPQQHPGNLQLVAVLRVLHHLLQGDPEDASGKFEYPIVLSKPLIVEADVDNHGKTYSQLSLSIRLWEWNNVFGCGWNEINTFGLLSNLDACTHGVPCPIKPGRQTLKLTIDFSKFQAIIGLLKNNAPYQIQITLADKQSSDKTCVMAQGRALTH
ncbi:hypothetical protein L596_017807 [Steinernema carpocapsae]|uniref:MD-2-related lipid-recognition domain-containing protein n=1 Tax=Steinernema carpocapsae TaxID=34508 RepID=A0A4U5N2Q9_STECR|nr:hypothetical protein L596_017807 [Steinernema carpocapsae]